MSKGKKALIRTVCIAAFIGLAASPLMAGARSMAIMGIVSAQSKSEGLPAERGFELVIPAGAGWSPLVMAHNADNAFGRVTGQEGSRLTIFYNFPSFSPEKGCSRLFDETSPYYNSFYGAYVTSLPDGSAYGFDARGGLIEEKVAAVARLDFFGLVLNDFGLERDKQVFEYAAGSTETGIEFAGSSGWVRLDAVMRVNGAAHERQKGVRSYWQYGKPRFPVTEPFAPVDMLCTVIAKHFEEWESTVFFYVMSPDEAVRDNCVDRILAGSVIRASFTSK